MHHLTPTKKATILTLNSQGKRASEIAAHLGVTAKCVREQLRKLAINRDPYYKAPGRGRPRALSARDIRQAARAITSGNAHDATDVQRKLFPDIHPSTVRRALTNYGLPGRVRRKKPLLTKKHKRIRAYWAKQLAWWKADRQWCVVWFSDEAKFNLVGSDRRRWCRRRVGEEFLPKNVEKKVKGGGGKVNVWGVISWDGVGRLHRVKGNLDARQFVRIMRKSLLRSFNDAMVTPDEVVFQQDNDPKHTAKISKRWFRRNKVRLLPWPASSPDMNPIEHVWHILGCRVRRRSTLPRNANEMWKALKEECYSIDKSLIRRLISSMPRRIAALSKAKGSYTKY